MTDLIWFGNTLFPRWVLLVSIGLNALIILGSVAAISKWISK